MKILFLQDDFPPQSFGGAGISTYELAMGMKNAGHEVFVITTSRKEEYAGERDYNGIKVFTIQSDYSERWRWYISIYNRPTVKQVELLLRKINPDIVHANNIHFHLSYYCLKLAKKYAKAVVFTVRDVMVFNFAKLETKRYLESLDSRTNWLDHIKQAKKRYNPFRNFVIKKYLGYVDKIIVISHSLKVALEQNGIKDTEVIHIGLDTSKWEVQVDKITKFKSKYELQDKKVIFFGGRLSAAKGGEKVIMALKIIVEEVSNAVLLVVGELDWYGNIMKEEAKNLGVDKHLVFTGWLEREEIKIAYGVADIVLMPSICFDAFGRVNIEAMASKKPVIGTCYGGTPEIVVDGVTGYIVNPLYPKEIAERTIDLLENPQKAQEFGEAGYKRVRDNFNLKDMVEKYIAVYNNFLNNREAGSGYSTNVSQNPQKIYE